MTTPNELTRRQVLQALAILPAVALLPELPAVEAEAESPIDSPKRWTDEQLQAYLTAFCLPITDDPAEQFYQACQETLQRILWLAVDVKGAAIGEQAPEKALKALADPKNHDVLWAIAAVGGFHCLTMIDELRAMAKAKIAEQEQEV